MKNLLKLSFVLGLALLLGSCSKDGGGSITGGGSMTAKVDGASYNASLAVQATLTSTSPKVLAMGGTGSAGQINITIGNYAGAGTYTIGAGNPSNMASFTLTTSPFTAHTATSVLGSGTVTVTSDAGGKVQGTFSFTGVNNSVTPNTTKVITDGSFNINL